MFYHHHCCQSPSSPLNIRSGNFSRFPIGHTVPHRHGHESFVHDAYNQALAWLSYFVPYTITNGEYIHIYAYVILYIWWYIICAYDILYFLYEWYIIFIYVYIYYIYYILYMYDIYIYMIYYICICIWYTMYIWYYIYIYIYIWVLLYPGKSELVGFPEITSKMVAFINNVCIQLCIIYTHIFIHQWVWVVCHRFGDKKNTPFTPQLKDRITPQRNFFQ